jgi:hypothetical protein
MGTEHPGTAFYRFSLMSLRDAVVGRGTVTQAEVDDVLSEMDGDDGIITSPAMVAAWGRAVSRG